MEARLSEISNQLELANQRLVALEKTMKENQQSGVSAAGLEKKLSGIEALLDALISDEKKHDMSRMEAKLEGIHKLLIILTDNSTPEQK